MGFKDFSDYSNKLKHLQIRFNVGRFLAVLSFIPILTLLGTTKSTTSLLTRATVAGTNELPSPTMCPCVLTVQLYNIIDLAATYFLVATILMGTVVRDKYTPLFVVLIADCDDDDYSSTSVGYYDDYDDDGANGGTAKYSLGASFGLYVVVLAVLSSVSVLAAYCHLSGKHLFGGEGTSDLSYQLMSQPYAVGEQPMPQQYGQPVPQQYGYAYPNTSSGGSGMQAMQGTMGTG